MPDSGPGRCEEVRVILFDGAGRRPRNAVMAEPEVMSDMRVPRSLWTYFSKSRHYTCSLASNGYADTELTR